MPAGKTHATDAATAPSGPMIQLATEATPLMTSPALLAQPRVAGRSDLGPFADDHRTAGQQRQPWRASIDGMSTARPVGDMRGSGARLDALDRDRLVVDCGSPGTSSSPVARPSTSALAAPPTAAAGARCARARPIARRARIGRRRRAARRCAPRGCGRCGRRSSGARRGAVRRRRSSGGRSAKAMNSSAVSPRSRVWFWFAEVVTTTSPCVQIVSTCSIVKHRCAASDQSEMFMGRTLVCCANIWSTTVSLPIVERTPHVGTRRIARRGSRTVFGMRRTRV